MQFIMELIYTFDLSNYSIAALNGILGFCLWFILNKFFIHSEQDHPSFSKQCFQLLSFFSIALFIEILQSVGNNFSLMDGIVIGFFVALVPAAHPGARFRTGGILFSGAILAMGFLGGLAHTLQHHLSFH